MAAIKISNSAVQAEERYFINKYFYTATVPRPVEGTSVEKKGTDFRDLLSIEEMKHTCTHLHTRTQINKRIIKSNT